MIYIRNFSTNSWIKIHALRTLLLDILHEEMGYDLFTAGEWAKKYEDEINKLPVGIHTYSFNCVQIKFKVVEEKCKSTL